MNAMITPESDEITNVYIQFNDVFFNMLVVMPVSMMNEKTLIQNFIPNFKLKVLLAMMNCMKHVANCTQRLVYAAPCALNIGINKKFNITLINTPSPAT